MWTSVHWVKPNSGTSAPLSTTKHHCIMVTLQKDFCLHPWHKWNSTAILEGEFLVIKCEGYSHHREMKVSSKYREIWPRVKHPHLACHGRSVKGRKSRNETSEFRISDKQLWSCSKEPYLYFAHFYTQCLWVYFSLLSVHLFKIKSLYWKTMCHKLTS